MKRPKKKIIKIDSCYKVSKTNSLTFEATIKYVYEPKDDVYIAKFLSGQFFLFPPNEYRPNWLASWKCGSKDIDFEELFSIPEIAAKKTMMSFCREFELKGIYELFFGLYD